jgi:phosphatidylinositol glycan class B
MLTRDSPLLKSTVWVLLREIAVCGTAVLALSLISDRLYFGFWTFPPYKWLYFNISQSLAVFYGHMPWHYYLSQGVPLLTTTFLPFTVVGIYKAASSPASNLSPLQSNILRTLAFTTVAMIATLSLISHKEVRFIYPLLPVLHILAAPYISAFFTKRPDVTATTTNTQPAGSTSSQPSPVILRHKLTLANILSLNLLLAGYLSIFHQSAPIAVLSFLRSEFERIHPDALALTTDLSSSSASPNKNEEEEKKELFALFLTPCHSTPWRSHLVYPALRARALTCEPPLHTAPGSVERQTYLDEADRFYLREGEDEGGLLYGVKFLAEEMWPGLVSSSSSQFHTREGGGKEEGKGKVGEEEMPRYIVGFEGIEPVLEAFFGQAGPAQGMGVKPRRVWSAWNGLFNDDWRRRGRLVVWDTGVYGDSYKGIDDERGEGSRRVVEEL